MVAELTAVIQETDDPVRLEELLGINDQLLTLLKNVPIKLKQTLKLQGLGLSIDNGSNTVIEVDGKLDGYPHLNGGLNGHTASIETCSESNGVETDDESTTPTTPSTPRVDKGKRRAEPEEHEMVLSPKTFMIGEPDNHEEESYEDEGISPMDRYIPRKDSSSLSLNYLYYRSRILVEEEGEVFRKGIVLLGPAEMEGDYAGEELRREVRARSISNVSRSLTFIIIVVGGNGRTTAASSNER